MKQNKILYCYSQEQFDDLMRNLGWTQPIDKFSTVSISSPWNEHFDHFFKSGTVNNINIDCDDIVTPFWWDKDYYDEALDLYLSGKVKEANQFFLHQGETYDLRLLNYEQAFLLVSWIDKQIVDGHDNFYIHCAAGISRSQAIVRYILDTYKGYHWKTRKDNPCNYYNNHMLIMLKRAAYSLKII